LTHADDPHRGRARRAQSVRFTFRVNDSEAAGQRASDRSAGEIVNEARRLSVVRDRVYVE
jgi:hypothetical protein